MKKQIETERLILREIVLSDADGIFQLDSNPNVHIFVGKKPVTNIQQSIDAIEKIQQQYKEFGIGRWAVILKETNEFIGWSGIKFIQYEINNRQNFYELGYRFIEKHWGKGYSTEAATAFVKYAFDEMKVEALYAYADEGNETSRKVLEKLGFRYINSFEYENEIEVWYELRNQTYN